MSDTMNPSSFKNILCIALPGFLFFSCRVSLPADRSRKSLSEPVYVERIDDSYVLHLDRRASDFQVNVEAPEPLHLNTKDNALDSVIVFKNRKNFRPYFDLVSGQDTLVVTNRRIDFDNTVNFRDLGGLKTKDGKTVNWGKIFRSDNLSELKSSEFQRFNQLKISTVFDLRTNHEIEGKEDRLPANVKYIHTPTVADNEGEIAKLRKKVISGAISESEAARQTTQFYQDAVTVHAGALKEIIQQITRSDEPVLYHCSAGKDRTGIVSALLLSILNVDRETIVDEYMMSNYYRSAKTEKMLGKAKFAKIIKPRMDLKAIEVFMTVDENFINATFDVIDKTYGGMEPFIKNQLGIDAEMRKRIIVKLTH
jgi:protein-tyrosine phosphatase